MTGFSMRKVVSPIRGWLREGRAYLNDFATRSFSPHSGAVPARWIRQPPSCAGEAVCLFVTLARQGEVPAHSLYHLRSWTSAGFKVVAVIVGPVDGFEGAEGLSCAAGILVRENRGYDFGAWAAAINRLPTLRDAALVAIVNDSVLGPFHSDFRSLLHRVVQSKADFIGAVESYEVARHYQSFLLFFKPGALRSKAFGTFWRRVRTGDRDFVIRNYELKLLRQMKGEGLKCEALFPGHPHISHNRTLTDWRELVAIGFPYVKISLLRDNPYRVELGDWQQSLREWGYDPSLADPLLASAIATEE